MCPDDHRINRQENWRFESLGENLHHSGGEMICVTCGKRRIYDITFNSGASQERYSERVDGVWYRRKLSELTW